MTRKPKRTPIACARCETRLADPSKRLFSAHTRLRYCTDPDACGRRELPATQDAGEGCRMSGRESLIAAPRIVATGDWHGELPAELPEGDILVIAGDLLPVWNHEGRFQSEWTKLSLIPYLTGLPFRHVVFIAGNHDFLFMESKKFVRLLPENVHYLEDETVVLDGIKFHGSPWANRFGNWVFMLDEAALVEKWALIPDDTDVLIVHGPPFGACDLTARWGNKNVGSKSLRERLVELRLPLVITGHIHEGYGSDRIGVTAIENVSLMDVDYVPINVPRVLSVAA